MKDKEIFKLINKETIRQKNHVELIASENFVSKDVLKATGSIFTNKYSEGYPNKRYYSGCENVDQVEDIAIDRAKKLFNAKFANVQPHSGSQANFAAYNAILNSGDVILGMDLKSGGHLTHGFKVSVTGKYFKSYSYDVDKKTHLINYDEIRKIALKVKPKLIICGASAYSRIIDWKKFKDIAKEVGAYLLADVAHIAGLIIAGLHPNPLDFDVDIVTTTTHKTLRGARGGLILTNNEELSKKIDASVFPGVQGGPLMHSIAGKAVAFYEALQPSFNIYQKQIIDNAKAFCEFFLEKEVSIIAGGTDNHLFLIDVKKSFNLTGLEAENLLYSIGIITNKNTIPFDEESPFITSGIRVGTPAMTTRGWKEDKFIKLAEIIYDVLNNKEFNINEYKKRVRKLL